MVFSNFVCSHNLSIRCSLILHLLTREFIRSYVVPFVHIMHSLVCYTFISLTVAFSDRERARDIWSSVAENRHLRACLSAKGVKWSVFGVYSFKSCKLLLHAYILVLIFTSMCEEGEFFCNNVLNPKWWLRL